MATADSGDIEYSIFVYFQPTLNKKKEFDLIEKTTDMDGAFKKAEHLSTKSDYYKVEVKQRYFEPKTNRELDMVLKTFESRPKKPMSLGMILFLTVLLTAAAFGGAYFVGNSMTSSDGAAGGADVIVETDEHH